MESPSTKVLLFAVDTILAWTVGNGFPTEPRTTGLFSSHK